MDKTRGRNKNDYNLYEKSYMKKSKKVLSNIEESRSKSNSRLTNGPRDISPVYKSNAGLSSSTYKSDLMDPKKYLSMKKESGGILSTTNKKNQERAFANNESNWKENRDIREERMSKNQLYSKEQLSRESYNRQDYLNRDNSHSHITSKSPNLVKSNYSQSQFDKTNAPAKSKNLHNNYLTESRSMTKSRDTSGVRQPNNKQSGLVASSGNVTRKNKSLISSSNSTHVHNNNFNISSNASNVSNVSNANGSLRSKNIQKTKINSHPGLVKENKQIKVDDYICNDTYLGHSDFKRSKSPTVKTREPSREPIREQIKDQARDHKNMTHKKEALNLKSPKDIYYSNKKENESDYILDNKNYESESVFTNYKKMKKQNEFNYSNNHTEIPMGSVKHEAFRNLKITKYSSPNTEESGIQKSQSNLNYNKNEFDEREFFNLRNLQNSSTKNKISLEKKDSFSLIKTINNHSEMDNILCSNKETTDSIKYKMTNTHSSGPTSAMHLEEVKAMFEKLDPEEYHLISVNLIQSSKRVVRKHEHVSDKDNLFSTVTKCDERDL